MQTFKKRKRAYVKYLLEKQEECHSAKRLGLSECQRCGYCCILLTCVPKPDEIEQVAKHLNMSVKEMVKRYMVVDRFVNTNFFLRWAKESQKDITGGFLPRERLFDKGYCILYDKKNKGCLIHKARPDEAKDVSCWETDEDDSYRTGASYWKETDILKFIPKFSACGDCIAQKEDKKVWIA